MIADRWRVAGRLAGRDLRAGRGLSGLVMLWLCLAIAIAGVASVTSLSAAIDGSIAATGRTMLGGDLMLSVAAREPDADEIAAMNRIGPHSHSLSTRGMINAVGGRSMLAEVTGADATYPLAGAIAYDPGGHRPGTGEVAIGREAASRLAVRRGDRVRIGTAALTISATFGSLPQGSGFALAPPALLDLPTLRATGLIQPGSIYQSSARFLLADREDPQAIGRTFQAAFSDGGWRASDRNDAGSGTRTFVDRLGQLLLLIALSALAIGSLGMAAAAAAFATSRQPTIAILKLVGASRGTVERMLMIELGLICGLAIIAGLAVGAVAPAVVGRATAGLLPVAIDPAPRMIALAEAAAFGLLVSFAACWTLVSRAARTRPSSLMRGAVERLPSTGMRSLLAPAIAIVAAALLAILIARDHRFAAVSLAVLAGLMLMFAGLGVAIREGSRPLAKVGPPAVRLGLAALSRPGSATVRLAVSLGVGLSLLATLGGISASLLAAIDGTIPARAPALFMIDIPQGGANRLRTVASSTIAGADLRLVPSLRGPVTAINGQAVAEMRDIPEGAWVLRGDRGLTFARDLPPGNVVTAGAWWPADYRGPPLVSLDADAATALNLKVGDRLTIAVLGRPVEARISSLRRIDWRSLGFNFAIIFAPGTLEQAPYSWMASVSPRAGQSTAAFESAIATALPTASTIRIADIVAQVRSLLQAIGTAIRLATLFALAMGVVVLAGSVVATRAERARDIVLLRLVGATRWQAAATQMVEFLALSAVVALVASAVGAGVAWAVVHWLFRIDFVPGAVALAATAAAAVLTATVTALVAARPALISSPATGLRRA